MLLIHEKYNSYQTIGPQAAATWKMKQIDIN